MRVFLFATLLVVLFGLTSAQTFCQTYSNTTTNSTAQVNLITAIVSRAATGGTFPAPSGASVTVAGLFSPSGPLYNIFTGATKYRVGAPNYVSDMTQQASLASKLVSYFGALFGCTASGFPAVNNYNMYAVHQNMSINNNMETYFNAALAQTLLSFGVSASDVSNVAAPALGLFNRCGPPTLGSGSGYLAQICGTADCPLATNANNGTCTQYYSGNGASGKYAVSGLLVAAVAIVASLML